jgi:hypothetical protein
MTGNVAVRDGGEDHVDATNMPTMYGVLRA